MSTLKLGLMVMQGGQTGVDRGAFRAAQACGLKTFGFAPQDARDELGPIPSDVMATMRPWARGGLLERTQANVEHAALTIAVVQDKNHPYATPGTMATLKHARARNLPTFVADAYTAGEGFAERHFLTVFEKLRALLSATVADLDGMWHCWACDEGGHLHPALPILVAGPRASLWPDGERVGREFVEWLVEIFARGLPSTLADDLSKLGIKPIVGVK